MSETELLDDNTYLNNYYLGEFKVSLERIYELTEDPHVKESILMAVGYGYHVGVGESSHLLKRKPYIP